jgi:hypothetical protein
MSAVNTRHLSRQLRRLYGRNYVHRIISAPAGPVIKDLLAYRDDPVGFARDVLQFEPTEDQEKILRAFPGRIKVNAGHSVGKTAIAAVIVLWWYHTRPVSTIITTAPTERDVVDLLWKQIRIFSAQANLATPFIGPRAPEIYHHELHSAKGFTARTGTSFQGRHDASMLFIFDECEDIDPVFWTTTGTMYKPEKDHSWLAIGNPVTTSSQSYLEDRSKSPDGMSPKWKTFTLSALNHPNIAAELEGHEPPVPNAVSLSQVYQWFKDWADRVPSGEQQGSDFEWPVKSGQWWRPGPLFKSRVLGIRPEEGVDTVWSTAAWESAIISKVHPSYCWEQNCGITIGSDIASYGNDDTTIHVRSGPLSLHHEHHNGWSPKVIAERIKVLCVQWADWYNNQALVPTRPQLMPGAVKVIIELDGPGVAVLDRCDRFGSWSGIKVGEASDVFDMFGNPVYINKRSEIWFSARDKALAGKMDLSRLPQDVLERLREQLLAASYKLQGKGVHCVEPKDDMKDRLGRSPDDADGMLVAFTDARTWAPKALFRKED